MKEREKDRIRILRCEANGGWHKPIKKRSVYGMPIKFQAWNVFTETMIDLKKVTPLALDMDTDGLFIPSSDGLKILQAIGATSADDPPQELYFGDLVEVAPIKDITKYPMIGELVWHKFGVYLRHWNTFERDFEYWSFHSFVKSKTPIKKLGSRYTHPEILKKAELLENEDQ